MYPDSIFPLMLGSVALVGLCLLTAALLKRRGRSLEHRSIAWLQQKEEARLPVVDSAPSSMPATVAARYRGEWDDLKRGFPRFPGLAVAKADDLLGRLLDGDGSYRPSDPDIHQDTLALGIELGWGKRSDLKKVFDYYARVIEETLAGYPDEVVLEPGRRVDRAPIDLTEARRHRLGWSR